MAKPQFPIDGKLGKNYKVTSNFGWRTHPIHNTKKHHNGVDLWGSKEPLYIESWHDGLVIFAGPSSQRLSNGEVGGFGWYVDVRSKVNGKFYVSRYAHLVPNSLKVKKGQKIEAGAILGKMGTSGASTGKHLHFEICSGKSYRFSTNGSGFVDPMKFVKATIDSWDIQKSVKQATPEDALVQPAPVHEPVKKTKPLEFKPLRRGSKGKAVQSIQSKLKLKADGDFGPITEAAVKNFQKQSKLPQTGIVDRKTWDSLLAPKTRPVKKGK
jgi:murein DD-endopeptidase MepM/ murein hydrolase activator NlpD